MSETLHIEEQKPSPEEPRRFPLLSVVVLVALAGAFLFYFWSGRPSSRAPAKNQIHLPFGPAEQAYASKIQFEHLGLNRAENFLHQEITALAGEVMNAGDRPVRNVEVTVTYSDELHQVVLRESRVLFGPGALPLPPGGRREFEISYEHIPSSWNREAPVVTVTGLQF
ncbi:MAG TPA: hypothetical protein VE263_05640 [Candidatus Angelobacter sp.]|nr:hypothetical protein [Candidatus Angelobacter sp.]